MTAKELAEKLDGVKYEDAIPQDLSDEAERSGLVIVYGMSYDLVEICGAIFDDVGAWDGIILYFYNGVLLRDECDNEECPYFCRMVEKAKTVEVIWNDGPGHAWTIKTDIPHEAFMIQEGGEDFSQGIIFSKNDI